MTGNTWGRVCKELEAAVGKNNFVTWIKPLKFESCDDGVARFNVPTVFIGDWVSRNFGAQILEHLNKAGADVARLDFQVPSTRSEEDTVEEAKPAPASSAASLADAGLPGAPLDERFTFDRFVVRYQSPDLAVITNYIRRPSPACPSWCAER